ncbi:MAG: ATP-grasp domain-containing protein [Gammaproteobacteria bacterium]|nr:ATP-grasp domain-containing protein [Gammaproteobacteria bacterium]
MKSNRSVAAIFGSSDCAYFMSSGLLKREIDIVVFASKTRDSFGNISIEQCPSPDSPTQLVSFLKSYANGCPGVDFIVIPSSDEYAMFFANYHSDLAPRFQILSPPLQSVRICANKLEFSEFCEKNGIDAPRSYGINSEREFQNHASSIDYPVIVKPIIARGLPASIVPKVILAEDHEELLALGKKIWALDRPLFFQELIPGSREALVFVGGVVRSKDSEEKIFVGTKIMDHPKLGGNTTFARLQWQEEAVTSARSILRELEFDGLFDIEFKRDHRDGLLKVIEVNPRIGLWHRISDDGEMDIISYYYSLLTNCHERSRSSYIAHVDHRKWMSKHRHLIALVESHGIVFGSGRWFVDLCRRPQVRDWNFRNWRRNWKCVKIVVGRFRQLGVSVLLLGD